MTSVPTFYLTSGLFGEFLILNQSYDTALKKFGDIELKESYIKNKWKWSRKYCYNGNLPREIEKKIALKEKLKNIKLLKLNLVSFGRRMKLHRDNYESEFQYVRDSANRIVSLEDESERKDFLYDTNGNLVSYVWHTKTSVYCGNTICKWTGFYDNSQLKQELLTWSNGEVDTINHIWEKEKLIRTIKKGNRMCFMSCDINYYYFNGLLSRIEYDIDSKNGSHCKTFLWQKKTTHNTLQ